MLERVISGGQTGADRAGWRAAKVAGIPTGGAMPRGFMAEDGPHPEYALEFGAHELDRGDYQPRAEANVRAADATLWFGDPSSTSGRLTLELCHKLGKSVAIVSFEGIPVRPSEIARLIIDERIKTLNVDGSRERARRRASVRGRRGF